MTENMKWTRAPKSSDISDERIEIVTEPHTDPVSYTHLTLPTIYTV